MVFHTLQRLTKTQAIRIKLPLQISQLQTPGSVVSGQLGALWEDQLWYLESHQGSSIFSNAKVFETTGRPALPFAGGLPNLLALVPVVAQSSLDSELLTNLDALDAIVIESDPSSPKCRSEIVDSVLLANPRAAELAKKVDHEIAEDFHALGYAFLQIQIMTRQLRYSTRDRR